MAVITIVEFSGAALVSGTVVIQAPRGPERRVTQITTGTGDQFVVLLAETTLVRLSAADDADCRWSGRGAIGTGNLGAPFAAGGEFVVMPGGSTIWVSADA